MLLAETDGHMTDRNMSGKLKDTPTGTDSSKGDPKTKKRVLAQILEIPTLSPNC